MPTRPGLSGAPRDFLTERGTWPAGPFEAGTPEAVRYASVIVTRLYEQIRARDWSNTTAAAEIGIGRQALQAILAGRVLPDLHTLARAEAVLEVTLWPDRSDVTN